MRWILTAGVAAVALAAAGAAAAEPVLEIKHAVARVVVVPEDRVDIKVEMLTRHPDLPLEVRTLGERTIIDGGLRLNRIGSCDGSGERASVQVRGVGKVAYADMPQIVVRTPRKVDLSAGGAVYGAIGRAQTVELSNAGCGDWTIANVAGELEINVAGSGDVRAGSAGRLDLSVAGSGDVYTKAIAQGADVEVAGSGGVDVASASGEVDVRIAGSGDVLIRGGRASDLDANIAGSGSIDFRGEAAAVSASIAGSGDVRVARATGPVSKSIVGSGDVVTGR